MEYKQREIKISLKDEIRNNKVLYILIAICVILIIVIAIPYYKLVKEEMKKSQEKLDECNRIKDCSLRHKCLMKITFPTQEQYQTCLLEEQNELLRDIN